MRFHPVRLREAEPLDPKAGPMEVVLVNGRRVRVPQGFVAEDLARVLEVVEGGYHADAALLGPDLYRGCRAALKSRTKYRVSEERLLQALRVAWGRCFAPNEQASVLRRSPQFQELGT